MQGKVVLTFYLGSQDIKVFKQRSNSLSMEKNSGDNSLINTSQEQELTVSTKIMIAHT